MSFLAVLCPRRIGHLPEGQGRMPLFSCFRFEIAKTRGLRRCPFCYMSLRIFDQMTRTQVHNFTLFRRNHEMFSAFTPPEVARMQFVNLFPEPSLGEAFSAFTLPKVVRMQLLSHFQEPSPGEASSESTPLEVARMELGRRSREVVWSLGLELDVEEAWPGGGSGEGVWSLGLGLDDEEAWRGRRSGEGF